MVVQETTENGVAKPVDDTTTIATRNKWLYEHEGGERVIWETHSVTLHQERGFGFGIAVSGGVDNPHFANGDPSIAISDVLKGGPAENKLLINDRVLSVNGISLENVEHATAIAVLKDSGDTVNLVIRRKVLLSPNEDFEQPFKVTLSKKNKKDDYGLVLGYKLYIRELRSGCLAQLEGTLREGDTIVKLNNISVENLSLSDARKQIDKSKEKLQLVVMKGPHTGPRHRNKESDYIPIRAPQNAGEFPQTAAGALTYYNEPIYGSHHAPASSPPALMPPLPRTPDGRSLKPITYEMLDLPLTPQQPPSRPHSSAAEYGSFPAAASSTYVAHSDVGPVYSHHDEVDVGLRRRPRDGVEPRFISFKKDHNGVGIRISGGNKTGIFVAAVAPRSPADQQGLLEGDLILKVNDVDMQGKTREDAVLLLLSLHEQVNILVQYYPHEYAKLMASGGTGDSFYIKTHFAYEQPEHGEMAFANGTVFHVTDTLFGGVVGSYYAARLGRNNAETQKGTIPNTNRAEQLTLNLQQPNGGDNENSASAGSKSFRGGSFFKKKARRAKSLNKDNWEDVVFGVDNDGITRDADPYLRPKTVPSSKFSAYERVLLKDPGFKRPLVLFGPLADVSRDRILKNYPSLFESPQSEGRRDAEGQTRSKSGIIRMGAIRQIMDKRKHCILEVTPNAVDRLNYAQYAPIVVFLKPESKNQVKDLRLRFAKESRKSARKLYEQAARLEKDFIHLFTHTVTLTNGDLWFRKLIDTINNAQLQHVWMAEAKPVDPLKEDYLFPMNNRLSYASSPESDVEMSRPHSMYDDEGGDFSPPMQRRKLTRASSDPSLTVADQIPGIPPYNNPPVYHGAPPPPQHQQNSHYDYPPPRAHRPLATSYADLGSTNQPEARYYPSYYASQPSVGPVTGNNIDHRYAPHTPPYKIGAPIDNYATLTPSERARSNQALQQGSFNDAYNTNQQPPGKYHASPHFGRAGQPPPSPIHAPDHPSFRGGPGPAPGESGPAGQGRRPQQEPVYQTYRVEQGPLNVDPKFLGEDSSYSGDSYSKYTSHPANKHDDSKLQEKYKQRGMGGGEGSELIPGSLPPKNDPYRFTRSTLQKHPSGTNPVVDRNLLQDLSHKYRAEPPKQASSPSRRHRAIPPQSSDAMRSKSETTVHGAPPPAPSGHNSDMSPYGTISGAPARSYQQLPAAGNRQPGEEKRDSYARPRSYHDATPPHNTQQQQHQQQQSRTQQRSGGEVLDQSRRSRQHPSPSGTPGYQSDSGRQHTTGYQSDGGHYERIYPRISGNERTQAEPNEEPVSPPSGHHISTAFTNEMYMSHDQVLRSAGTSSRPAPSTDSGLPGSLDRSGDIRSPNSRFGFESYKKLVTPGCYKTSDQPDRDPRLNAGESGSAFESYRKPAAGSGNQSDSQADDKSNRLAQSQRVGSEDSLEGHTVVATARGVFDHNGGVLESKETGVSIVIPRGAIAQGVKQEIYFKVCQDNSILPPLDKNKGETLLSPLVMCGPHGLRFLQPVELRLPHCASVNPDSWSFALKSSDSPSGAAPTQWQNMTLAGLEGVSQGRVGKNSVSVLVDHF